MKVATAPTVYGIETFLVARFNAHLFYFVATAPTVYGIETIPLASRTALTSSTAVATAPTVYGIETTDIRDNSMFA